MLAVLAVAETLLQLLKADRAIAVLVERLEHLLELLDVARVGLHSDGHKGNLLDSLTVVELLDVAKVETAQLICGVGGVMLDVREHPWVLEGLGSRQSLGWRANKLANEVLGLVVDVVPLFALKVELTG